MGIRRPHISSCSRVVVFGAGKRSNQVIHNLHPFTCPPIHPSIGIGSTLVGQTLYNRVIWLPPHYPGMRSSILYSKAVALSCLMLMGFLNIKFECALSSIQSHCSMVLVTLPRVLFIIASTITLTQQKSQHR